MFSPVVHYLLAAAVSVAAPLPAELPKVDDTTAWPAVKNSEFKLTAELVVVAQKDAKGVLQLANGANLSIRLKAEKDCEVAVYWIDTKGEIVQLFPNRYDRDGRLKAGEERVLPGKNTEYTLAAETTKGEGIERLHAVAITGAMPAAPKGEQQGPFMTYRSEVARKEVIRAVRGVVVRDKTGAAGAATELKVAQVELPFRVKP